MHDAHICLSFFDIENFGIEKGKLMEVKLIHIEKWYFQQFHWIFQKNLRSVEKNILNQNQRKFTFKSNNWKILTVNLVVVGKKDENAVEAGGKMLDIIELNFETWISEICKDLRLKDFF